jgi:transposase
MQQRPHHHPSYRKAVLLVYRYNGSMRLTSKIMKVSVASISRWDKAGSPIGRPSRGSKFTDAIEAFVLTCISQNCTVTAAEVRQLIWDAFNVQVSRQLVALVLKHRLRMSWKRTRKRGTPSCRYTPEQLTAFRTSLLDAYNMGTLASTDESGFDQRVRPIYGYAPLG